MRTKLYWCKTNHSFVELALRDGKDPICFNPYTSIGNTCSEPETQFMSLPAETLLWTLRSAYVRLKLKTRQQAVKG